MPGLIIWKNQQVDRLRKDMDRMFDRLWGEFGLSSFPRAVRDFPEIDLTETEDRLILKAKIPGMKPDDIQINISEDTLSIRGSVNQDSVRNNKGMVQTEQRHRSFSKQFRLPCPIIVDEVKATYKEEVLNVIMPKFKQKKARAVKIEA